MVMLTALVMVTPCLAEETGTDSLWSIGGTQWQTLPLGVQLFPYPWLVPYDMPFGFYGGEVYPYLESVSKSFYMDLIVMSIFGTGYALSPPPGEVSTSSYFGIVQPIGIGIVVVTSYQCCLLPLPSIGVALIVKTSDAWMPTAVE